MATFLFFCWIFLTLLTTKFSSPAWTLFLAFSESTALQWFQLCLSDRYGSASVDPLQSSSPSQLMYGRCASGISTGSYSLRPVHYASLRYHERIIKTANLTLKLYKWSWYSSRDGDWLQVVTIDRPCRTESVDSGRTRWRGCRNGRGEDWSSDSETAQGKKEWKRTWCWVCS